MIEVPGQFKNWTVKKLENMGAMSIPIPPIDLKTILEMSYIAYLKGRRDKEKETIKAFKSLIRPNNT